MLSSNAEFNPCAGRHQAPIVLDGHGNENLITGTRILTCAPLCSRPTAHPAHGCAVKWEQSRREQCGAINMVLRRLFMVSGKLLIGWAARVASARIPRDARGILKGGSIPAGIFGGHLSSRKVYMVHEEACDAVRGTMVACGLAAPAMPQSPSARGSDQDAGQPGEPLSPPVGTKTSALLVTQEEDFRITRTIRNRKSPSTRRK